METSMTFENTPELGLIQVLDGLTTGNLDFEEPAISNSSLSSFKRGGLLPSVFLPPTSLRVHSNFIEIRTLSEAAGVMRDFLHDSKITYSGLEVVRKAYEIILLCAEEIRVSHRGAVPVALQKAWCKSGSTNLDDLAEKVDLLLSILESNISAQDSSIQKPAFLVASCQYDTNLSKKACRLTEQQAAQFKNVIYVFEQTIVFSVS